MAGLQNVSSIPSVIMDMLTRFRVHFMLGARFFQVRQSSFQGIIGAKNVDIHHRFESIGRQLLDGGKEITRGASTAELVSSLRNLTIDIHHKIDSAELLNTALNGILQRVQLTHIHGPYSNNLGAWPRCRDIVCDALGLLGVATDDACICA